VPQHLEDRRLFSADGVEVSATAAAALDAGAVTVVAAPVLGATTSETGAERWAGFVSESAANGGAVDPNALVQYVLRESYLATTEDLRLYADKVQYFNTSEALLADHLSDARPDDAEAEASDSSPDTRVDPD
jgi:hypothetical protein